MIAERYTARGIPTMPEQIMVTTGAMGAIDAICHLFAGRGERIAVESPVVRQHPSADAGGGRPARARRDGRGARRLGPGPLAPGAAGRRAPDRLRRRRLPQPHRRARRRGPAATTRRRRPLGGHGARRRRDDDRAAAGPGCRDAAPGVRLRPGRVDGHHGRFRQQGLLGRDAHRLGAGGSGRDPQPRRRSCLRGPRHARPRTAGHQLAAEHGWLGAGGRDAARPGPGEPGRAGRGGTTGTAGLGVRRCPRGGLTLWVRTGGLSGSRIAEAGERVGVRVPSGPRFGVDGAFEGYVRLPFTVGGAVADEAAVRLAAAARIVASGGSGGASPPVPSWPERWARAGPGRS